MKKLQIYKQMIDKLWMIKDELWSYELEIIDEVIDLIHKLEILDNKEAKDVNK